jgi:hypothetical protein
MGKSDITGFLNGVKLGFYILTKMGRVLLVCKITILHTHKTETDFV